MYVCVLTETSYGEDYWEEAKRHSTLSGLPLGQRGDVMDRFTEMEVWHADALTKSQLAVRLSGIARISRKSLISLIPHGLMCHMYYLENNICKRSAKSKSGQLTIYILDLMEGTVFTEMLCSFSSLFLNMIIGCIFPICHWCCINWSEHPGASVLAASLES